MGILIEKKCKKDLELYYSKVKQNCYIIGDDAVDTEEVERNYDGDVLITWSPGCYGHYGVIKAFREFCENNNNITGQIIENQFQIKK